MHPLAAQTVAFLKRLLAFRSAAAVVFAEGEPSGEAFGELIQTPAQASPRLVFSGQKGLDV